ncbi:hypothetical protein AMS68_005864 [Peltaster fructicola]|uniref:t-SNARE coiled-coil homology domain-containing protein n=1 Tax=Peltaster fructicola TaxID=286661 RepID=A0A6H0Y014_9PEZI|nr:hypothetical protein AMS68_005864 [Peltaster fructicola]
MSAPMSSGAWRDRTNLFISYRQSYTHHPSKRVKFDPNSQNGRLADPDSESAGLLATNDAVIEMDVLPPRWLDVQDEIAERLTSISAQMKRLDQLHAKHVLPGFDDESVKIKEEREIEGLTNEITRGFTSCQSAIRRIDQMVQQQRSTREEETMARNLKISLAGRVGEVSTTFRKKQAAYLKKLRALGGMGAPLDSIGGRGTPSIAANPYTDPAMQESEQDRSSAQSTLQQTTQVRRRTGMLDAQIDQREREIETIAKGIIDLSNIFQEIQTMVIDQGSMLDRIDYNVENTAEQLKSAEKELKVATNYQKRNTKRWIMLLLILIIAGIFILIFLKPRRSTAARPETPEVQGTLLRRANSAALEVLAWDWKHRRRRAVL